MGQYTNETRIAKFAWMREQQKIRREAELKREREMAAKPKPSPPPNPDVPAVRPQPPAPAPPELYRVKEVAGILKVHPRTVTRWFARRAILVGGGRRRIMLISRQVLDDWLREHDASGSH